MDSVGTAFELISVELDTAVENLNTEGAGKFRASNYVEAKRLTDKGIALQDFCRRVKSLAVEWADHFAEEMDETVEVVDEAETARRILSASKGPKTELVVQFPDGSTIFETKAAETLAKAIEKIGFSRVEALGIRVNKENIVSRQKSLQYQDVHIPPFYIKTHSNTEAKKRYLDRISEDLGLGLTIVIVA